MSLGFLQLTPLALSTPMQRPKPEVEHLPDLSKPRRSPAKRTTPQRIARDGTAATAPGEWNARVQFWDRAIPEYNALTDPNARVFTNSATFRRDYKSYLEKKRAARVGLRRSASEPKPLAVQAAADPALPGGGVGGMPTLELAVLKAVGEREHLIARVHVLLERAPAAGADALQLDATRAALADLVMELRNSGVAVTEAIGRWRRRRPAHEAFVWRSHNYMLKMTVDLFFLGLAPTLADAAEDPFLLRCFDEPQPASPMSPSPKSPKAGRAPPTARALLGRFAPSVRHTKHQLLRMWAAERVLEAERTAAAFAPSTPALDERDAVVRAKAGLFFFGSPLPEAIEIAAAYGGSGEAAN